MAHYVPNNGFYTAILQHVFGVYGVAPNEHLLPCPTLCYNMTGMDKLRNNINLLSYFYQGRHEPF